MAEKATTPLFWHNTIAQFINIKCFEILPFGTRPVANGKSTVQVFWGKMFHNVRWKMAYGVHILIICH